MVGYESEQRAVGKGMTLVVGNSSQGLPKQLRVSDDPAGKHLRDHYAFLS